MGFGGGELAEVAVRRGFEEIDKEKGDKALVKASKELNCNNFMAITEDKGGGDSRRQEN